MSARGPLLLGVILLVAALSFFLLGGYEAVFGTGDSQDDTLIGDGTDSLDADAKEGDAEDATAERRGPRLFGLKRAERVGVGSVLGVVKSWETKEALSGVRVRLQGRGYGDESIQHIVTTDEGGRFYMADQPAGDGLLLTVQPEELPQRALTVQIENGDETDLGEIWVGKTGLLTGRVLGFEERGVSGADVEVHPDLSAPDAIMRQFMEVLRKIDQDPEPIAEATSADKGRFEIADVPPGPFTLVVRARGHLVGIVNGVMESEGAAQGEILVRLQVAKPIVGKVVDTEGRPVGGARVALMPQNETGAGLLGRQFAETDREGRFEVGAPPTGGKLMAVVAHEDYASSFQEVDRTQEEVTLTIEGGARLTLVMQEMETGRPIEGMRLLVFLMDIDAMQGGGNSGNIIHAVTDHRGEAAVMARPTRVQFLMTEHEELGSAMWMGQLGMGGMSSGIQGPKSPEIPKGDSRMVFKLVKSIELSGTITGPDGAAVVGARVSTSGAFFGGQGPVARSDDAGKYRLLVSKSPMGVMVKAEYPGMIQPQKSVHITPDKVTDGGIRHDIQMERSITVTGRILDPGGKPVASAQVRLIGKGNSPNPMAMAMTAMGGNRGITDSAGRYVIEDVRAGSYRAVARRNGFVDTTGEEFTLKGSGLQKAPDLRLERGQSLKVLVREPDGRPLSGARVELDFNRSGDAESFNPMDDFQNAGDRMTDKDGFVVFEDLAPGSGTLTANARKFAPGKATFKIIDGEALDGPVEVRLERAFPISGKVVSTSGKGLARVALFLNTEEARSEWQAVHTTTTDANGKFSFDAVAEGNYVLMARGQGYRVVRQPVQGGQDGVRIELAKVSKKAIERQKELNQKMMEIGTRFATAQNDAEREALMKEIQLIQQELREVNKEIDPEGSDGMGIPMPLEADDEDELETEVIMEQPVVGPGEDDDR